MSVPKAHASKGSEAKRTAEALFETKSIAEIREVEKRTRRDVEVKKQQLKQLVGDSYRDLIESADKIVAISNVCGQILGNVKGVRSGFASLAHSFASSDSLLNEKRDSLTRHEELAAVGSRVKYLVDTPEVIWGCLDSRQYLEAARRLLRAHQVHALLLTSFPKTSLDRFPLLAHQWPLVQKFREQILEAVRAVLSSKAALATEAASDALAAASALQDLDSAGALQLFLSSRCACLLQQLEEGAEALGTAAAANGAVAANGAADGAAAVAAAVTAHQQVLQLLTQLAQSIQTTISQVGQLFLPQSQSLDAASATCLLQATVRENEADASELLFSGRGAAAATPVATAAAPGGAPSAMSGPEVEAWRRAIWQVQERLVALTSGQVEQACTAWLRDLAARFGDRAATPLLRACGDAAALVDAEAAVHAALARWQPPSAPGVAANPAGGASGHSSATTSALSHAPSQSLPPGRWPPPPRSASSAAAQLSGMASGPLGDMGPRSPLASWEAVCEWVLGFPLNVWGEVFHAPFLARARELVAAAFEAVARGLEQPLQRCLEAAARALPQAPGNVDAPRWPLLPPTPETNAPFSTGGTMSRQGSSMTTAMLRGAAMPRSWSEKAALGQLGAPAAAVDDSAGFRQQIQGLRQHVDAELARILSAVLQLLSPAETAAGLARRSSSGAVVTAMQRMPSAQLGKDVAARAAELEPFVQDKCAEMVAGVASALRRRLDAIGAITPGPAGAPAAEQALLLGRLCTGLASESRFLPLLLGPPEAWKAAGPGAGAAGGGAAAGAARLRGGGVRAGPGSQRLQAVMSAVQATALSAYQRWASWAAQSLASELRHHLEHDDLMTATTTPLSWQEVVVAMGGAPSGSATDGAAALLMSSGLGDGSAIGDMRFHLPACPSPATMSFLAAACQEVRRAGDHAASSEALQLLAWELGGAALRELAAALGTATAGASMTTTAPPLGARLSEKGVLQLLLDVRLIRETLAGGRPLGAAAAAAGPGAAAPGSGAGVGPGGVGMGVLGMELQDPTVVSLLAERRKEGLRLEQALQDRLDPIDWATYEPYFWSNAQRYAARVSVLFGSLMQLQRAGAEPGGTSTSRSFLGAGAAPGGSISASFGGGGSGVSGSSADMNPLSLLPVAPRFQYLPISTPTAAGAGGAASVSPLSGSLASSTPNLAASGSFGGLAAAGAAAGGHGQLGGASRARVGLTAATGAGLSVGLAGSSDLAGSFSFADLGGARGAGATGLTAGAAAAAGGAAGAATFGEAATAGMAAGASALSALQARFQTGSLGSFGTMLGDKAAEISAMTQQRFDMTGFTSLGSGLFSSLTKTVKK